MINNLSVELTDLLGELRARGIRLVSDGDALRVRGARDALTPALTERISRNKRDLLIMLNGERAGGTGERIAPRPPGVEVPLSFLQQNLWLIDQMEGSIAYNMAVAMRIGGDLQVPALEKALQTIVERHESVRTVFRDGGQGRTVQVVRHDAGLTLGHIDLRSVPSAERESRTRQLYSEEAARPFDLANDLMLRAQLLRTADDAWMLLLTLHHIVGDSWSMDVLLDEMTKLYAATVSGDTDVLPPLPVQYGDYAVWLTARMQGEVLERKLAFWEQRLAALPVVHSLPLDRPRPTYRSVRGESHISTWTVERARALHALCSAHNVTLFMLLEAALAALLARWSGESDIVIGTPVSGRTRPELAPLIGYLTNTVVLRSDCDENQSFTELLAQTQRTMLEALEHSDVPFEMLLDRLKPSRSLGHSALVQIIFTLQNNHAATFGALDVGGVRIEPVVDGGADAVKFDLHVTVREMPDGLRVKWDYNADIFDNATIARMDRHFELLLGEILVDPARPLWQLATVSPEDTAKLVAWNATTQAFPDQDTLSNMVERRAAQTPHACALVDGDRTLDYAQLNARANQLAHFLVERYGISANMAVGLCVPRSIEMVVALLAIMKAGGAYVPLDPALPAERLAYMMQDSGAVLVLAGAAQAGQLPEVPGVGCVVFDDVNLDDYPATDLAERCGPATLAYVIYTSGSTGRPKGTLNLHRGPCNRIHAMQRQFNLTPSDRVLQKTPLSFDVSVWELFWPLSQGATLVLASPDGHTDPAWLAGAIRAHDVTVMHFVPSMLQAFLRICAGQHFPSLRYVMASGEALSYELQEQAIAAFPGVDLINHYGPTETAVEVSWWRFDKLRADRLVPIGAPLDNVRLHVLDRHDRTVPIGVAGELHIAGIQVGEGYLNKPELTAERFVECQVGDRMERLYRTGDKARWLGDGQLAYLGRLDNQVKLRGLRIELGEIEAALREEPAVEEAVVALWGDDGSEHQRLVGWVTLRGSDAGVAVHLADSLRRRLPEYMVPAQLLVLPAFPLSPSGKIDRRALTVPDMTESQEAYAAPASEIERKLCAIWEELLKVERVGIDDNFFAIGGNSILAARVVSKAGRQGLSMSTRDLFSHATVRALATQVRDVTVGAAPDTAAA